MRRNSSFILAVSAFVLGPATAVTAADGDSYCPPGSKFCPAPGTNNTVFLDTHFGMDAQTGEVKAYQGTVHPNEVANAPMTGEQVLYTAPPISVENRYVPYPGSPQTNMDATTMYVAQPQYVQQPQYAPQPQYAQQPHYAQPAQSRYYPQPAPAAAPAPAPRREPASEVAHQQTARDGKRQKTKNGEKVPWWKGGLWRNKKDERDAVSPGSPAPRIPDASASGDQNDLWGDDDFDGYNRDGSFGQAQAQAQPANGFSPAGDPYAGQGFDPFGQPQGQPYSPQPTAAAQTYGQPLPESGPRYAGDSYTLPDAPGPTSPYQPGYVYPGTDLSYETPYQGGVVQQPAQQQYYIAPPQEVHDPFAASAPASQGMPPAPSEPGAGTPQFANAVRMVKENRFNEAKSLLVTETSRNPSNAAAWRWLADCHYNLLELDDALANYQRALDADPNDYYALRGQGFTYLHRGHEYWRRMQEEIARGQKDQAAATFSQAHENYKKSLEILGFCLRRAPNDGEAIYGEAMAAEGASRKLYSNAISFLKLGPDQRNRAELFAENCLTVINKGIARSRERAQQSTGDAGPRALLAGLYLRKAILYHNLGKNDLALIEVKNSRDVQQSILDEIDKNNATAQKNIRECEAYWEAWGGNKK